ncbi:hypothetical protein VPH35_139908 [Triticum aestivum]
MGHPSALLGLFVQRDRGLVFVPAPSGPTLGSGCRFLPSPVGGVQADLLDGATPVTARHGLLLVRLARGSNKNSVHLAVYDSLTRTCDVLPPLQCGVSCISCAILIGSDYRSSDGLQQRASSPGYSTFFTVQTLVNYVDAHRMEHKCNLYMFSSAKASWSAPTSCFGDKTWAYRNGGGFWMPYESHIRHSYNAVVCGGMTHWLAAYQPVGGPRKYHTFNVSVDTGHVSLTEVSIPLVKGLYGWPILCVGVEGALVLLNVHNKAGIPRLDIWTRRGGSDRESETFWLPVGVFDLKSPTKKWCPAMIRVWLGEKSGTLFILDASCHTHKLDIETGAMEDVTGLLRYSLSISAVSIEIDWPALFLSRLA